MPEDVEGCLGTRPDGGLAPPHAASSPPPLPLLSYRYKGEKLTPTGGGSLLTHLLPLVVFNDSDIPATFGLNLRRPGLELPGGITVRAPHPEEPGRAPTHVGRVRFARWSSALLGCRPRRRGAAYR